MSGHSKWSTIKRQKQAGDTKRALTFSKLASAITLAVKQDGVSDPTANFRLRLAVEKARAANMPKDNIERAIERGVTGGGGGMEEVLYEGFGPGGGAIVVEAATDNHLRTNQALKNAFERSGGTLAGRGATSHFFTRCGLLTVDKPLQSDAFLDAAIAAGVTDVAEEGNTVYVYTPQDRLHELKELLVGQGYRVREAELIYRPVSTLVITDRGIVTKLIDLVSVLEDNPDVQKVFVNFDIPNDLLT